MYIILSPCAMEERNIISCHVKEDSGLQIETELVLMEKDPNMEKTLQTVYSIRLSRLSAAVS